jgi:hypothetical protein
MRTPLAILCLLAALALQPALAGGWGHRDERREPPRPQQRMPEPPRPQPRMYEPPRQMYEPPRQMYEPPRQNYPPPNRGMSNGQAAQRAQQLNGGGRVLAVDPAQSGYRVRVLKDGEVRSVYVPGQ